MNITCKYTPRCVRYKTGIRPCSTSGTYIHTASDVCTAVYRNLVRNTSSRSCTTPPRRSPPQSGCSADRECRATRQPDPRRSSWERRQGRRDYDAQASCLPATSDVTTVDAVAERWASSRAGRGSVRRVARVGSESSDGRRLHETVAE